jgi:uncharacterized protein (TIGR03382 family)
MPPTRIGFLLLVVLTTLIGWRSEALACSCGDDGVVSFVYPASGETDVPRDSVVVVAGPRNWNGSELPIGDDEEPVLMDEYGGTVPVAVDAWWNVNVFEESWFLLVPETALDANATYRVVFGMQTLSTFTTGAVAAAPGPGFDGLRDLTLERFEAWSGCAGLCWRHPEALIRIRLDGDDPGPDEILRVLHIREEGAAEPLFSTPVITMGPYRTANTLESFYCAAQTPLLRADRSYCARLVAYSRTGQTAGGDREVCRAVLTCDAPAPSCSPGPDELCEPKKRSGCSASPSPPPLVPFALTLLWLAAARRRARARC